MSNLKLKIRGEEPKLETDNEIEMWLEYCNGAVVLASKSTRGAQFTQTILILKQDGSFIMPTHYIRGLDQLRSASVNTELLEAAKTVTHAFTNGFILAAVSANDDSLRKLRDAVEKMENLEE